MDFFGDDINSILGNDDLNRNIISDDDVDPKENDENDPESKDEEGAGTSKTVDPKRRTVRNPQLRLNVERLIVNDRGVHTLENCFQNMKYRGKGHEKEDLDNVLKRIEHWAHRLYPKYNFTDFLAKAEQLGKKKQLQTHMYRYRQGMLELVNKEPVAETENDDEIMTDQPFDDIDELLGQQIEKYKTAPSFTPTRNNTSFDSIRSSVVATPRFMGRPPVQASTPMSSMSGIHPLDTTGIHPLDTTGVHQLDTTTSAIPSKPKLTSEQIALIALNRQKALEKLKARREAAAAELLANNVTTTTNNNETPDM